MFIRLNRIYNSLHIVCAFCKTQSCCAVWHTCFLIIVIFYNQILNASTPEDIANLAPLFLVPQTVIRLIYHTFFIYYYGATLGKKALKIKCINQDKENPSFGASLSRALVRFFSEAVFYLGFAWAFFDPLRQTWHDKVAKTLVVNVE